MGAQRGQGGQGGDGVMSSRGAIIRLFGVILIILGTLNTMLSWRGGFQVPDLPVLMIAAGALLCLAGGIRRPKSS